jgi:hypothetical protein
VLINFRQDDWLAVLVLILATTLPANEECLTGAKKPRPTFQDMQFTPKKVLSSHHDTLGVMLHAPVPPEILPQDKAVVTKTFS